VGDYIGQPGGKVQPLSSEHPNPSLLFTEHDRRRANEADKADIPLMPMDLLVRLTEIVEANNSVQAKYFIDRVTEKAKQQGINAIKPSEK